MYRITSNNKHGGIWDGKSIVKEYETDNSEMAEGMKAHGYTVEEITLDLNKLNAAQLKKYAKEHSIDLGDATQKDQILEIIKAAEKQVE
jgi:hypothetical protein